MRISGDLSADFQQMLAHRLGVGCRHDDGGADTTSGAEARKVPAA